MDEIVGKNMYYLAKADDGVDPHDWNQFLVSDKVHINEFMDMCGWLQDHLAGNACPLDGSIWIEDEDDYVAFMLAWSHNRGQHDVPKKEIKDTWLPKTPC